MKELTRLQVGQFSIQQTITIEQLKEHATDFNFLQQHIIPIEEIVNNKIRIILDEKQLALFLNGVKLPCKQEDGIVTIYTPKNQFIGTAEVKHNVLKRDVIL